MPNNFDIVQATLDDLDALVPLFDGYRQFYGQDCDEDGARVFLADRLQRRDSVIFLATCGQDSLGMTQLFPSFSSVAMRPVWILNDLFVEPAARRRRIAEQLIERAVDFAQSSGACRLELATAHDNRAAQSLYAKLGWAKDDAFIHYKYTL